MGSWKDSVRKGRERAASLLREAAGFMAPAAPVTAAGHGPGAIQPGDSWFNQLSGQLGQMNFDAANFDLYQKAVASGEAFSKLTNFNPRTGGHVSLDIDAILKGADPDGSGAPHVNGLAEGGGPAAKYDADGRPIRTERDPKTIFTDPYAQAQQLGYRERPRLLPDAAIDTLIQRAPPLAAILQTQVANVAKHATPVRTRFEQGFRVKLRDADAHPTEADRKRMKWFENAIMHCGFVNNGRHRDTFEGFLRKIVNDSLRYDAMAFEIVPSLRGRPAEWFAVDARTIRLAETGATFPIADAESIRTVAVYESMITAKYTARELAYEVRNPRADIRMLGYGVPEIEMIVLIVTALLNAQNHNRNFFSNGVQPRGLLALMGQMTEQQLQAFREDWNQMLSGSENCLPGDQWVWTRRGRETLTELHTRLGDQEWFDVWTGDGWQRARVYPTGPKRVLTLTTESRVTVRASDGHRFRSVSADGELVWRDRADLREGDWLVVERENVEAAPRGLPQLNGRSLDADMLEVIGWLSGDGYWAHEGRKHGAHNVVELFYEPGEEWIRERHLEVLQRFGVNARALDKQWSEEEMETLRARSGLDLTVSTRKLIRANSVDFTEWLSALGFTPSAQDKLPAGWLHTAPAFLKGAFLRGLFSANGFIARKRTPGLAVRNDKRRQLIRELLLSMGIRCSRHDGSPQRSFGKQHRAGRIDVRDRSKFFTEIGFLHEHKQPRSATPGEGAKNDRCPPSVARRFLLACRAENDRLDRLVLTKRERMDLNSILAGADGCSRARLLRFMDKCGVEVPDWLTAYSFDQIVELRDEGTTEEMFDLEVADDRHQFMVNGIACHNSWRTPIVNSQDAKWIPMIQNNRDMEFSAWMEFLLRVCAAIYQMDPVEINFKFGNAGGKQMVEAAQKSKVQSSQERGLKPLLRFIARAIDKYIIEPIDPRFSFEFCGLENQTPKEMADLLTQQARSFMTVDEVRASIDYAPLPKGLGQVLLDANWMNAKKDLEMREAEEKQKAEQEAQIAAQEDGVRDALGGEGGHEGLEDLLAQLEGKFGAGDGGTASDLDPRDMSPVHETRRETQTPANIRAEARGAHVEGERGGTEDGYIDKSAARTTARVLSKIVIDI